MLNIDKSDLNKIKAEEIKLFQNDGDVWVKAYWSLVINRDFIFVW